MNKKLFLGMFAAAGMLLATSCSNDELDVVQSGNEAQVTFSLGLEGGIATRAISDGTGAKTLICAVYDANDANNKVLLDKVVINDEQVDNNGQYVNTSAFQGGLKDNVRITLAKGQTYTMVFWAQNGACDAYDTDDLTAVKVSYKAENGTDNASNNDETRDAFYAAETFKVEGNKEINVTLKRPFAQINVGVYKEDWEAAVASGITIDESSVVIKNVADEINLLTGAVKASEAMENGITYALNAIPNDPAILKADANNDGTDEEYQWLSMSYILVNDTDTDVDNNGLLGTDQALLEGLQFTFKPETGEPIEFKEGLAGAPVRRNWRTNILGKLLTGDIQFNITIDPAYNDDYIYPDGSEIEQELEFAATFGGTVTLPANTTVSLTKTLNVNADMIINMNGSNISGEFAKNGGAMINNSASLKLVGGTIKNTTMNGDAIIRNEGNLVLDGVTIQGAPIADGDYPSYAINNLGSLVIEEGTTITSDRGSIYINDGAEVTINGGNINISDALGTRVLTAHVIYVGGANSKLTINDGNFAMNYQAAKDTGASVICPANKTATINVYGGNFVYAGEQGSQSGIFHNFMGYGTEVNVYGGTYNDKTFEKNLATGYAGVDNGDDTWTVVAGTSVNDAAAFITAIQNIENGKTIVLSDDITLSADNMDTENSAALSLNGVKTTINLNGKTLKAGHSERQRMFYITGGSDVVIENGKLEVISTNGQVDGTGTSTGGSSAVYCDGANITMKNVEIVGSQRGGHRTIEVYDGIGNFENITIDVNYGLGINAGAGAEATLTNCNITVNGMYSAPYNSTCFSVMGGGKMHVVSGNYKLINNATYNTGDSHGGWVGIIMSSGGTINLNGGTFTNVPATSGFNPQYERPLFTSDAVAGTESLLNFAGGTYSPQEDQIVHKGGSGGTENVAFKGEIIGQGQYNINDLILEKMTNNNNGTWTIQ